jgi:hypothetical protein
MPSVLETRSSMSVVEVPCVFFISIVPYDKPYGGAAPSPPVQAVPLLSAPVQKRSALRAGRKATTRRDFNYSIRPGTCIPRGGF